MRDSEDWTSGRKLGKNCAADEEALEEEEEEERAGFFEKCKKNKITFKIKIRKTKGKGLFK